MKIETLKNKISIYDIDIEEKILAENIEGIIFYPFMSMPKDIEFMSDTKEYSVECFLKNRIIPKMPYIYYKTVDGKRKYFKSPEQRRVQ